MVSWQLSGAVGGLEFELSCALLFFGIASRCWCSCGCSKRAMSLVTSAALSVYLAYLTLEAVKKKADNRQPQSCRTETILKLKTVKRSSLTTLRFLLKLQ